MPSSLRPAVTLNLRRLTHAMILLVVALLSVACATPTPSLSTVQLHLDGTDRTVSTDAATVRALCSDLEIELGPLDLIEPPLWTPLVEGLAIRVTRGYEDVSYETLPHDERTIRDEFLAPLERQVLRQGADGQAELRHLLLWDGDQLLERRLLERRVVTAPVTTIHLEGSQGLLPNVALSGSLAYLVNGEPWILRRDTDHKRPLARGVQADGRVFDLSRDGRYLLYSAASGTPGQLNELYVVITDVLNTRPQPLEIANVLWAAWSPDGQQFAYSTLKPIAGLPGWRAVNDLHLLSWPARQELLHVAPDTAFIYAWYGERWVWRPDGRALAYTRPDSVGLLDLSGDQRHALLSFAPGPAGEETAWLPELAFAPDSAQLALTLPGETLGQSTLNLLDLISGDMQQPVTGATAPTYGPAGQHLALALPQGEVATPALVRLDSLQVSALRQDALMALPVQLAWGPEATRLIYTYAGDLYLYDLASNRIEPLTATGLASHPVWR